MQTESQLYKVAEVLGLSTAPALSRLGFSDALAEGLPVAALERVQARVAPTMSRFSRLIVAEATLKRRRQKDQPLSPQESERLARVARVWTMAMDVYKSEAKARRFLTQPHPLLHERQPLEVAVATDAGAEAVAGVLGRLRYGTAA